MSQDEKPRLKGPKFKIPNQKPKKQGPRVRNKTTNKGSRAEVEEPKRKPISRTEEAKNNSRNQHYGPRVKDE